MSDQFEALKFDPSIHTPEWMKGKVIMWDDAREYFAWYEPDPQTLDAIDGIAAYYTSRLKRENGE